ncbi:hypothetical protein I8G32_04701 [Rhodopseudomonas palustris]|uniref:DNA primase/polymerase bifunctional N-terminal domain-containing protein n=2 Tax=Rhodopseudomonas palustris (strain ATCC BAA-98 / CGA009) TaxID=258594 RepID=Q6N163_RHOPA|nr:hypothetical protein I8G32_04701 [Rhodopseudomonas palustris]RJF66711.1 hypothetical protein D4Q71_05355 [Rhodopseudomonas palustris]CAE29986.1 conserved hypothetical protein [Rhodopseudomonas palustris CGA009]
MIPARQMTFAEFAALGYTRLVPIIPHDAPISEGSSLFKRVGTKQDSRGKAVGVRGLNGWYGYDWLNQPDPDEHDLARWQRMGAGVGIMTGGPLNLIAVDADTLDQACAGKVMIAGMKHFGSTPVRIGRAPKAVYLIRVTEPIQYCRVEFGPLNDEGRRVDRVELLSDGRQFVAHGIHPVTKKPYVWTTPLCHVDKLPVVTPQQLAAFMDELRQILPNTGPLVTEGATTEVSQASLRGDIEKVRAAVAATPNTSAAFGTREAYRDFGYAIKAALPDDEPEAFEIFADWCARWEDGENDPDIVAADWRRMKPPFRRGASWIYELAEETSGGKFKRADAFFDVLPDEPESLFPREAPPAPERPPFKLAPTPYSFPDPASIPRRRWLYGRHYIRGFVSATVAPGGIGKSSLTIVEALAMTSGKPLLGERSPENLRVWIWNGEDPVDELQRRVAAAMHHYSVGPADVGDRLLIDSGMEQPITLAEDGRSGARLNEDVMAELVRVIKSRKIDAVIVDPLVSSHRVSENDNGAVDLVVKAWGRIAFQTGASVMLVHHVRKTNGDAITVEDARGASALVNGTRVARALTPMTPNEGAKLGVEKPWLFFRSGGVTKNNLAPAEAAPAEKASWFALQSVPLGNGAGEGVDALMSGDTVGVVVLADLAAAAGPRDPDTIGRILQALGDDDWRADVRAGDAWIGSPVAGAIGLNAADAADRAVINGQVKRMLRDGLLEQITLREGRNRKSKAFYRRTAAGKSVVEGVTTPPALLAEQEGVFA